MVIQERPKTDKDLCKLLLLFPWQLEGVIEYIKTGAVTIINDDSCEVCGGSGRIGDDIPCPCVLGTPAR